MAAAAQAERTSAQQMKRVVTDYVEAVNRHDLERMLSLRHPHAYLQMMGITPRIEGVDRLRSFYAAFLEQVPDYQVRIEGSAFGDDTAVVWGQLSGTVGRSFMGGAASGGSVEVPVCFVCSFEDGQFKGDHMYFDFAAFREQAGIDREPPGKERA